jgi:hypothetical protein
MSIETDIPEGFKKIDSHVIFEGLAELQVWLASNRVSDVFNLNIRVTFEFYITTKPISSQPQKLHWLSFKDSSRSNECEYRVRLRHCKLRLRSTECELRQDDKYEEVIQPGKFNQKTSENIQQQVKTGVSGGGSVTFGFGPKGLDAGLKVKGGGEASRSNNSNEASHTAIQSEVSIIKHIPFGWRIGHPRLGDPLQEHNNNCLSGTYFERPSDEHPYSCVIRFNNDCIAGRLAFVLSSRDSFYVERVDSQQPGLGSRGG